MTCCWAINPAVPGTCWSRSSPLPQPPTQVAVGMPANIMRQRPDIRKAERQLASATAQIGVAKADLYPSFSIFGSIGYSAAAGGNLFQIRQRLLQLGSPVPVEDI